MRRLPTRYTSDMGVNYTSKEHQQEVFIIVEMSLSSAFTCDSKK